MALGKTKIQTVGHCAGSEYTVPAGTKVAHNSGNKAALNWYVLEESDVRDCGVNDHDAAHYHLWVYGVDVQEQEGEV